MMMGLALLSPPGQAAKLDKANVAKDSKFVMHLDFDAIRTSKLGSTVIKQAREEEGEERIDAMKEIIGFDPFTALKSMTMSGNGEEENGLIVLKHAADTKKVVSFIKLDEEYRPTEYKERTIPRVGPAGERGYISFVNKSTAVIASSRELARDGIKLVNGKGTAKKLPGPIGEISKKAKAPFMMGYADLDGLEDVIEDPTVNDMAREAMMIVGESGDDLVMSVQVVAQSVETAEHMQNMVNGLIGFAALGQEDNPELKDLLKALKVSRKESTITVDFKMAVEKILEAVDPALEDLDLDIDIDLGAKDKDEDKDEGFTVPPSRG